MKILVIGYVDLDKNDGQSIHLRELVNNLGRFDNDVTLICPTFEQKNIIHCHDIIGIPVFKDRPVINSIIFQGLFCIVMVSYLLRHKVDVIYIRHTPFNIFTLLISKIIKKPSVIEVNYSSEELKMLKIKLPNIIIYLNMLSDKIGYNLVGHIVVVTKEIKDNIHDNYGISNSKISVVPNGTDIYKFRPIQQAKDILKLDKEYQYVCFVGNIEKWQGIEFLVRSAPKILDKFPNTKFMIVGGGKYLNDVIECVIKLKVRDNFIFFGDVPYEMVPTYINAGDICVAPFYKGRVASPIKLYEYMACEKPVIASDISDIANLLRKSLAGISVPPNDPVLLAENIIELLQNKELRDSMGKNGRKFIIENHTWEITAKSVSNICDTMITKITKR